MTEPCPDCTVRLHIECELREKLGKAEAERDRLRDENATLQKLWDLDRTAKETSATG